MTEPVEPFLDPRPSFRRPHRSSPGGKRRAFVAADPRMLGVLDVARRLSEVDTSVLIQGETGVGKDAVAERIHRGSVRAARPFVRLNCSALPPTLLERELFGAVRGAFTGANRNTVGYIEAAHGGTLFLDEVGELPTVAQVKLLNVLERREVRPVGSTEARPVDVRVISATHRDLEAAVEQKTFRADLYYRLSAFRLSIPPLRERPTEIRLLADQFAAECARRDGGSPAQWHHTTIAALLSYRWPGNVRELRNAVEYAAVVCDAGMIFPEHLPPSVFSALTAHASGERV